MDSEIRSTDAKGRICLPKGFANATVIIDQVSEKGHLGPPTISTGY